MVDSIVINKYNQLIRKKQEIEENYSKASKETQEFYDSLLELIEVELKLIYKLSPEIVELLDRRKNDEKRNHTRRYSKK